MTPNTLSRRHATWKVGFGGNHSALRLGKLLEIQRGSCESCDDHILFANFDGANPSLPR